MPFQGRAHAGAGWSGSSAADYSPHVRSCPREAYVQRAAQKVRESSRRLAPSSWSVAFAIVVAVSLGAAGAAAAATDHFTCYQAKAAAGATKFAPRSGVQ